MPPRCLLSLLALLFAPLAAAAEWGMGFEQDFDAESKPWEELQAQLPAAPDRARLLPFEVGPASAHRHFLDPLSISAGADGVVRYTMLIHTAGGAVNVSYEGMRCETAERKIYAFGRPDGAWSRNKYARWETIPARRADSYARELFFHYFCTVDGPAEMQVIQRALRSGGLRRGD
jgi:hypothetical protein